MIRIEGVVEDVVFHNEHTGYTVLTLRDGRRRITCVGTLPPPVAGERMIISGEWTEHRDYGQQLRIDTFESVRPTTLKGIERYLGSGIITGVGPATAKLIVHEFGEDALLVLDDHPDWLTQVPGIGSKRARAIAESYQAQRQTRQAMVFLQTYGMTPAMSSKVIKVFGEHTEEIVRADPYRMVEQVEDVGFRTADAIAFSLGVERESGHRIICGVQYILSDASRSAGHVFLPRDMLMSQAAQLLNVPRELCEHALDELILDGRAVIRKMDDETAVYDRFLYDTERGVAVRLSRILNGGAESRPRDMDRRIRHYEKQADISLGQQQREAVQTALSRKVCVVTGGPGTGKTTCIRCIMDLLNESGDVILCAPTGRAAKRMQEACGAPAQTIHRLLEYSGEQGGFQRNEDDPLKGDTLIVDEVSMVDIVLMHSLLKALPSHMRLILVGDADQLPSVGAGNVLGDLIRSGVIPVVRLTEIYRQAARSDIVVGAHAINRGEMPPVNRKEGDFFLQRTMTAQQAAEAVKSLVLTRLPGYLHADPVRDIQVLSPMKKGDAGVWALNSLLQAALNPPSPDKAELRTGEALFREGDKVMQIRNNYDLEWTRDEEEGTGAFNGDIGYITDIDTEESAVQVTFDDNRVALYQAEDLSDLEAAYCMSIHKSQGSEFEAVVIPFINGPDMLLTRNLLYTAVTRARRLAVLVGREDCVRKMVGNTFVMRRYSGLSDMLREVSDI